MLPAVSRLRGAGWRPTRALARVVVAVLLAGLASGAAVAVAVRAVGSPRVGTGTALAGRRPEHRAAAALERPQASSPANLLQASYRAARAERSFEISWTPFLPIRYWVLETSTRSQAVEWFGFTVGGGSYPVYTFYTASRMCVWYADRVPPGAHRNLGCSASSASVYRAEVFSFLSLTRDHRVGAGRIRGLAVTGVGGTLTLVTSSPGGTGRFSLGAVTVWIATRSRLPVAVTAAHGGHVFTLIRYLDWNSSTVRFPPGTPR